MPFANPEKLHLQKITQPPNLMSQSELLWNVLMKAGFPSKFINILKVFHNGMLAHVKAGGLFSYPFEVKVGVKQGCVLAPILLNIYLTAVMLLSYNSSVVKTAKHFATIWMAVSWNFADCCLQNLHRHPDSSAICRWCCSCISFTCKSSASNRLWGQHIQLMWSGCEILCQLSSTDQLTCLPHFHAGG